ncbi:MAG: hypothetical protein FWF52_01110 [Candidatus Azobacteroides sp.]|nr:hypothetical protein [Candidatus Azobacteroides sp.]
MKMDIITLIQTLVSSGVIIGIIEYFRYKKKDNADAGNIEKDNVKKTFENILLSNDTNIQLINSMRTKIDTLIEDFEKERAYYREQLRKQQEEIEFLSKEVNDLKLENKELKQQLHLKN